MRRKRYLRDREKEKKKIYWNLGYLYFILKSKYLILHNEKDKYGKVNQNQKNKTKRRRAI